MNKLSQVNILIVLFLTILLASCNQRANADNSVLPENREPIISPLTDNQVQTDEDVTNAPQDNETDNNSNETHAALMTLEVPATVTQSDSSSESSIVEPTTTDEVVLDSPNLILSPSTINTSLPEDILNEVTYFGGGGGGSLSGDCSVIFDVYEPTISDPPDEDISFMHLINVTLCGWQVNEEVSVQVLSPEGLIVKKYIDYANETGGLNFDYVTDLESQVGVYTFIWQGISGRVISTVEVKKPQRPKIYWFWDVNKEDTGRLILYGFKPYENIRVLAYAKITFETYGSFYDDIDENAFLAGWQEFIADEYGQLEIQSDLKETLPIAFYSAIGDESGQAGLAAISPQGWTYRQGIMGVDSLLVSPEEAEFDKPVEQLACPGAFPTRLSVGAGAKVVTAHLSVRQSPGANSPTVYGTSLSEGRTVTIIDGPVCLDGVLWWKGDSGPITLTNGDVITMVGWMAEESGSEWLLEPVP